MGKIYFGEKELHVHNNGISIFYWDLGAIFRHFLASYCQTANEKLLKNWYLMVLHKTQESNHFKFNIIINLHLLRISFGDAL